MPDMPSKAYMQVQKSMMRLMWYKTGCRLMWS